MSAISLLPLRHDSHSNHQVNGAVSRAESLITISDDVDTVMRKHIAMLSRSLSSSVERRTTAEKSMADGFAESEQAFQTALCRIKRPSLLKVNGDFHYNPRFIISPEDSF